MTEPMSPEEAVRTLYDFAWMYAALTDELLNLQTVTNAKAVVDRLAAENSQDTASDGDAACDRRGYPSPVQWVHPADAERLAARVAELEAVARAAVVKLDAVFKAINDGPIVVAALHGCVYGGPVTEPEYGAFKALLAQDE